MFLDNLNGVLIASVVDGHVKFGSNMDDESVWSLLATSLVSQSHMLGVDKVSTHELLDTAWECVEEQN